MNLQTAIFLLQLFFSVSFQQSLSTETLLCEDQLYSFPWVLGSNSNFISKIQALDLSSDETLIVAAGTSNDTGLFSLNVQFPQAIFVVLKSTSEVTVSGQEWLKQIPSFAPGLTGGSMQQMFEIRAIRFNQDQSRIVMVTDRDYFSIIILDSANGNVIKAIKDQSVGIANKVQAMLEPAISTFTTSESLIVAITFGTAGYIGRIQNILLTPTPSLSFANVPVVPNTASMSFASIIRDESSIGGGYSYYLGGTLSTMSNPYMFGITLWNSANGQHVWSMTNMEIAASNELSVKRLVRKDSVITSDKYLFAAGEATNPSEYNKGILFLRMTLQAPPAIPNGIKAYKYVPGDAVRLLDLSVYSNEDSAHLLIYWPQLKKAAILNVLILGTSVFHKTIYLTEQNQIFDILTAKLLSGTYDQFILGGHIKSISGCTGTQFQTAFLQYNNPYTEASCVIIEQQTVGVEDWQTMTLLNGNIQQYAFTSVIKSGDLAEVTTYTTSDISTLANLVDDSEKCCLTLKAPSFFESNDKVYTVGSPAMKFTLDEYQPDDLCSTETISYTFNYFSITNNAPCPLCSTFITRADYSFSVQTSDVSKIGMYRVDYQATFYSEVIKSGKFKLEIIGSGTTPTVTDAILTANSEQGPYTYQVNDVDLELSMADFFTSSDSSLMITYSLTNLDGTGIDTTVISIISVDNNISISTLSNAKAKTYNLKLQAKFTDSLTYDAYVDFDVIVEPDYTSLSVTVPVLPSRVFVIGQTALTFTFDAWETNDPSATFVYSSTLSTGAILPSFIAFNPTLRRYTVTSSSDLEEEEYQINVHAYLNEDYQYDTQFTLKVVCKVQQLQVLQRSETFTYIMQSEIENPIHVISHFTQIYSCNQEITYSAALSTGSPLPSWLEFDVDTMEFYLYSESISVSKDTDYRIQVKGIYLQPSYSYSLDSVRQTYELVTSYKTIQADYYWTLKIIQKASDIEMNSGKLVLKQGDSKALTIDLKCSGSLIVEIESQEIRSYINFKETGKCKGSIIVDLKELLNPENIENSLDTGEYYIQVYSNEQTKEGQSYQVSQDVTITVLEADPDAIAKEATGQSNQNMGGANRPPPSQLNPQQQQGPNGPRPSNSQPQQFKPPILKIEASIQSIDQSGKMNILFNQQLLPLNLSAITEKVLLVRAYLQKDKSAEQPSFKWVAVGATSNSLSLQLTFDSPLMISASSDSAHELEIIVLKQDYFKSKDTSIRQFYLMQRKIPKQIVSSHVKQLQQVTDSVQSTVSSQVVSNLMINIMISGSLQMIWGMINSLQILVILPLLSVNFPSNAQKMFMMINDVFSIKFIDFTTVQDKLFKFKDQNAINNNFEEYGYESSNAIELLSNDYYVLWTIIIAQIIFSFGVKSLLRTEFMQKRKHKREKKVVKWLDDNLFPHLLLRGLLEGSLSFSLCSFINIKNCSFANYTDYISFFSSLLFLLSLFSMAIFNTFFVSRKLSLGGTWPTYQSFYAELNRSQPAQLQYNSVFILHRLAVSAILVFITDYPGLQIMSLVTLQIAYLGYVAYVKPFEERNANQMEVFNQIVVTSGMYSVYILSDFGDSSLQLNEEQAQQMRYDFGWVLIGSVAFLVGVNSLFIIKDMLFNLYKLLKQLYTFLRMQKKLKGFFKTRLQQQSLQTIQIKPEVATPPNNTNKSVADYIIDDKQSQTSLADFLETNRNEQQQKYRSIFEYIDAPQKSTHKRIGSTVPMLPTKSVQSNASIGNFIYQEDSMTTTNNNDQSQRENGINSPDRMIYNHNDEGMASQFEDDYQRSYQFSQRSNNEMDQNQLKPSEATFSPYIDNPQSISDLFYKPQRSQSSFNMDDHAVEIHCKQNGYDFNYT